MEDEEVLAYKDFVLRRSDLDVLKGPCYLNDQIIGFYFRYLSSLSNADDLLLVPPSLSFWLANTEDLESVKDFVEPMKFFSKKLIVFTVNNNDDLYESDNGTHWSLLVYDRDMNAFVHHDSMEGANNLYAVKLYESVKQFVGATAESSSPSSKLPSAGRQKKKKKDARPAIKSMASHTDVPSFVEYPTPQQMNGYDCGLYVMAIARTICQWHVCNSKEEVNNWFSAMEKHVNASIESTMRTEVMNLIGDLRFGE